MSGELCDSDRDWSGDAMTMVVMIHKELELASYEREELASAVAEILAFVRKNEDGVDVDIDRITISQDETTKMWWGSVYYFARRRVRL